MKIINKIGLSLFLAFAITCICFLSAYIGQQSQSNINQITNGCYYEERFLEGQYIFNAMYCQNCLHFETKIGNETKYLFFADEHITNDKIQINKSIIVNWCYINLIDKYRIRGIWNK